MGAGIITLVGLLAMAVVLSVFPAFAPNFRLLSPLEQNLTRAGHGFALMVAMAAGFCCLPAARAQLGNLQSVIDNPRDHWPVIAAVFLFGYGLFGFIVGARRCLGCPNGPLAGRAFVTMALGGGAAWFLWPHMNPSSLPDDMWVALGWLALFMVCCWSALTGFIRFVLLIWPQGGALGSIWRHIQQSRVQWGSAGAGAGSGFWGFCQRCWKIVDRIVFWGCVLFVVGFVLLFVGFVLLTPGSFEEIFFDHPASRTVSPSAPGATAPRAILINPYPRHDARKTE
jgi:hypothetical protein